MTKPDAGPASSPELLVLHGVRVLGAPRMDEIAARLRLPLAVVREQLLDDQALGLVTRYDFGEVTWSLTERGRAENERRLAAELDATGARGRGQPSLPRGMPRVASRSSWSWIHTSCTDARPGPSSHS